MPAVSGPDDSVVIIGAGLMGAASAWALARRGRPVTVLEQFAVGHASGSSHGSARIVRRAYGDALYTRLTGRAFELWSALDPSLLRMIGALDFGPQRDVPSIAAHLAAGSVPHEVLPAAEAELRWPGMRFTGDVLFHAQGGTLDADGAVTAMLAAAAGDGAVVRSPVTAVSIRHSGTGVVIECSDGSSVAAGCVVVAAGGWAGPLLAPVVELPPLLVTREEVFHFPRLDPSAPPWPSVIHEDEHAFYHLAGGRDGGAGDDRKLGVHDGGTPTTAGSPASMTEAARARAVAYVAHWLPGLDPTPRGETTCLYTRTPSEDFLIDRTGPIVVCSPCSGHGAKFAPLVGEYVADLVFGEDAELPPRFRLAAHRGGLPAGVSL
jgi:glycine/D-amino acid oxidase-like deaminating enzyme